MSSVDLQHFLNTSSGRVIHLQSGEFRGPFEVRRNVTITGNGAASVLWAAQGPVMRVSGGCLTLENLSIEVTEDINTPAIQLQADGDVHFHDVRLLGKLNNLPAFAQWHIPEVIDFGPVIPGQKASKTVYLRLSDPYGLHASCNGVTLSCRNMPGGQKAVLCEYEEAYLQPGMLLDSLVEVTCQGITTLIRLTGEVLSSANTVARQRNQNDHHPAQLLKAIDQQISPLGSGKPTAGAPSTPVSKPKSQSRPTPDPYPVEVFLTRASDAEKAKDWERARVLLEEAIMLHPTDTLLRAEMAQFCERRQDFINAATEWEILLSLNPAYPQILMRLATLYNQTGQSQKTIQLVEKHINPHCPDAELYRILAMAYAQCERFEEAIWAIEKAHQLASSNKNMLLIRAWKRKIETS